MGQIDGGILSSRSFFKLTPKIPSSETEVTDETKLVKKRRPSSAGSSHLPVVGLSVQHTSEQTKKVCFCLSNYQSICLSIYLSIFYIYLSHSIC